jgi:hypothetical protein
MNLLKTVRAGLLLVLGLLGFVYSEEGRAASPIEPKVDIEVFVREGCTRCKAAELFLADLQRERPALRILFQDVGKDPTALARLKELAKKKAIRVLSVPAFYVRGELIIGYRDTGTSGSRLKALLDSAPLLPGDTMPEEGVCPLEEERVEPCEQKPAEDAKTIYVPILGRLSVRELGLPVFTLVLGLLDGFNPCAMWMLLFLLSLLVNLQDRLKMFLIGGTFVVISGLVYFAFMGAWLNIFLFIGLSRGIQLVLGGMAILIGIIHIKDFFAFKRGISLTIPETAKPGLYAKIRRILQAENLIGALAAVIVLAVLVNMIELLCTAGFPAIYTQILALQQLSWWKYYGYLALYNIAYMLDDSIMLTIALITLGRRKLQEKEGRWLKLVSGTVMLGLGIVLVAKPQWLA